MIPSGAITQIRSHLELYFRDGVVTLNELFEGVLHDIGAREVFHVDMVSRPPIALIAADYDWMLTDKADVPTLFHRFVAPPIPRVNSFRSEVVVAAVCKGFATWGPAGDLIYGLGGSDIPDDLAKRREIFERVLIWKMPTV